MLLIAAEVRPSPIHGLGVFALAPIRRGTVVWQLDPGIDELHPVEWLDSQPEHVRRYVATHCVLSLDKQRYLVLGDQSMFVNHALHPNLAPDDDHPVNGEGVVVAARDIAEGEELTINYADIDGGDRERMAEGTALFEPLPAGEGRVGACDGRGD